MTIERVDGGYIIKQEGNTRVATTLQEVFEYMLHVFEDKSKDGSGAEWGRVLVQTKPDFEEN